MKKKIFPLLCSLAACAVALLSLVMYCQPLAKFFTDYVILPYTSRNIDVSSHADKYYFSHLTEVQKAAYRLIYDGVFTFSEEIWTPKLTEDDFNAVHEAIICDNPELFFLNNVSSMIFKTNHCSYCPEYLCTPEDYALKLAEIQSVRDRIYAQFPAGADDYTKEKVIHDGVIALCAYHEGTWDAGIYGSLVKGKAVCSGYARAVKYLLDGVGIRNFLVIGTAKAKETPEKHMWNLVYLDGKPYYLDVTWDDGDYPNGSPGYAYFNVTQKSVADTHFPEKPATGECVYTDDNFFVRENRYFTACDNDFFDRYQALLAQSLLQGNVAFDVAFSDKLVFEQAMDALLNRQQIYDILQNVKKNTATDMATDYIHYSLIEEMYVLRLDLAENLKV